MSMIKSQIHDGFATIRTRGLHRSRSRAEQLEKLRPIVTKSDSVPLYEHNNNDVFYNFQNTSADISSISIQSIGSQNGSDLGNDYPDHFSKLTTTCNSFKNGSDSIMNGHKTSYENLIKTPPAPISPCYESLPSEFSISPKSTDKAKSDYFLYTRPESPTYGQIHIKDNPANDIELYNLPAPRVFTPTYYRKDLDTLDYALQKVPAKPPIKSHSLHYRKSYSHPAKTIYEDPGVALKFDKNAAHYYSASTNYYSPSEINSENVYKNSNSNNISNFELLSDNSSNNLKSCKLVNGFEKRYATLGYPKESQRFRQRFSSTSQVDVATAGNGELVDYLDPLDCKIGCQTTLRSKPRIPWYELAIKKDNRRQSCPPPSSDEVNLFVFIYFLHAIIFIPIYGKFKFY